MLEFQWLWGFLWERFWGVGMCWWGGWKWVKGLILVGLVAVGRGCLAYPNFFLENVSIFGNYPHFSA